MTKILKYSEYNQFENIPLEIINNICNPVINESIIENSVFDKIAKKLSKDLKFNFGLVFTFGTGIKMMIPIVNNLVENGTFNFELTEENIILLCITAVSITYLEETSNKVGNDINPDGDKSYVTKKDAQTMLEELKLRGIGQGLVKKFVNSFKSIGQFFKTLFRGTPYVINGLIDMFGYASFLIPCMNAISMFVGKYDINLDTICSNMMSIGIGVSSFVAKQGVSWLVNKLKNSLNIKNFGKSIDEPIEILPYNIVDGESDIKDSQKLIKEQ